MPIYVLCCELQKRRYVFQTNTRALCIHRGVRGNVQREGKGGGGAKKERSANSVSIGKPGRQDDLARAQLVSRGHQIQVLDAIGKSRSRYVSAAGVGGQVTEKNRNPKKKRRKRKNVTAIAAQNRCKQMYRSVIGR